MQTSSAAFVVSRVRNQAPTLAAEYLDHLVQILTSRKNSDSDPHYTEIGVLEEQLTQILRECWKMDEYVELNLTQCIGLLIEETAIIHLAAC